ncbi:MAG TPA: adenylate/guanylate cyclase domain-containing protein [Mycobacteriales bacterium]|nr:adenylate/guanylate cyclase domain-containing protein [Mycobacteriales bacterium]
MTADSAKRPARDRLRPYVSGLALQWLETTPTARHLRVPGSLAFIDISGFTALTERLASKGKVGAEEMSDLLDATFAKLLAEAYGYGASLVKWGGDAVLLLFEDAEHAALAARAAYEMRRTMRQIGRLRTSVGVVQLRMSVGINSGEFDFFMAGERHHELLTGGPAATLTALMEQTAEAGEIVVSQATAALLPASCLGEVKGDGVLLRTAPKVARRSRAWVPSSTPADPGDFLDPSIRDQLLTEVGDCEHRQVAVGFVEISGVDDLLARQGPGAVAAALHDLVTMVQEECAHHAVTFWETDISADGFKIMLVAGAPRSTGHDEEGMLRATRAMLDRYDGPVNVRIGVNCGRVFSGGFGPYFRRTWSVKGDAVNLAARVMGKAESGRLVATETLLRRVRGRVDAQLLAPFSVKGKRELVRAAVVSAATSDRAVVDTLEATAFIGRREQLDTLLKAAHASEAGSGTGVAVVGPAGIGKSRLVDHACARFDSRTTVLRSFGESYESATPYHAVRRLLRAAIGLGSDVSERRVFNVLRERVLRSASHLEPWLPLLAAPFGVEVPATPETREVQEQFRPGRTQSLVMEFLSAALLTPTAFVVDDVQHADDASASLLTRLMQESVRRPWLVLVVGRELPSSLATSAGHVIDVPPLMDEDATELVLDFPRGLELAPYVVRALIRRSEGNPLFLRELIGSVGAADVDELPGSLEELLSAQIDALSPNHRRLLRAVSVLGVRFHELMAAEIVGTEISDDDWRALDQFLARHADGSRRFRTSLARDTAYEGLPFRSRAVLHGRAASVVRAHSGGSDEAAAELCVHYLAAQEFAEAWHFGRVAGARARESYANAEALASFERAWSAAKALPDLPAEAIVDVLESIGDMRARLGELEAAVASYRAARRRVARGDSVRRSQLALAAALAAHHVGATPRLLRWLSLAERELSAHNARDESDAGQIAARIYVERANANFMLGRDRVAQKLCFRSAELAESVSASEVLGRALHLLDLLELRAGGHGDTSRMQRALKMFETTGNLSRQAMIWNHVGLAAYYRSDWQHSVDCYEQARQLFNRCGDEWGSAIAAANIAEIQIDQGHLEAAEPLLMSAVRAWRVFGAASEIGFGARLLGSLYARQRRDDQAEEFFSEAAAAYATTGERFDLIELELRLAEWHTLRGDAAAARTQLTSTTAELTRVARSAGLDSTDSLPDTPSTPLLLRLMSLTDRLEGDAVAAEKHARESLAFARRRESPHDVLLAIQVLEDMGAATDLERETAASGRAELGILQASSLPATTIPLPRDSVLSLSPTPYAGRQPAG